MKNLKYTAVLGAAIFLFIGLGWSNQALADGFDPNLIITNEEMLDSSSLSLAQIQSFLASKGSYLANYRCPNFEGIVKSAAEIIYDAAVNNYDCDGSGVSPTAPVAQKAASCRKVSINPKMLLVLIQKEQSLSEDPSPSTTQLDWAVGYGCPDGQACNDRWRGFGKQINSAALQFFDYVTNPQRYSFRAGNTYTISNTGRPPSVVTPQSHATAALYNYTPHVYNGNYNFWKLWMRYFTFSYLDGSLLQAKGDQGVWLIQDGKKRPFKSRGALTSRFDLKKVLQVSKADLDRYPDGAPIQFSQYSIVRSPRGTVFLLVDDKRRGFTSQEAFKKLGYNPEEVINATWEELAGYTDGEPITATTSYPMGALLQDKKTGGIYYVFESTKAPLWDKVLLRTKFRGQAIIPVDPKKLESFKTVDPAIFNDGELLKGAASPAVYVVAGRQKHPFSSGEVFEKLGYKWQNVVTVPDKILALYTEGDPIVEEAEVPAEIIDETASSSPDLIDPTATSTTDGAGSASGTAATGSTTEEIMESYE